MTVFTAKMRGVTVEQDGTQVPGTGRVATLNFRGQLVEYNAATGTATIGPAANETRAEVHAATTAALAANTRVSNTLTANANGALGAIDGVTLTTNQRLLVKDESSTLKNGWYYVVDPGSASTPWQLTRTADADATEEFIAGAISKVLSGTVNGGKYFTLTVTLGGSTALNVDPVLFAEYFPQSSNFKDAVRVATTAALATNTRTGNVLTASANGALAAIDGVTLVLDDRVLVKNEATGANNGIYRVTALGSAGSPWTMTRSADLQLSAQAKPNLLVPVSEGTTNGDQFFHLTTNATITLNTTALTFAALTVVAAGSSGQLLYNNAGSIAGAAGISVTGSGTLLEFLSTTASPSITQALSSSATDTTRREFSVKAQLCSGNTSTIGGTLRFEAGSATGAGGTHVGGWAVLAGGSAPGASGTRNGGDVSIYGGTGGTRYGNIFLGTDYDPATWNWQGMGRGLAMQDAATEPSADAASAFFHWSNSGRPKWRFNSTTLRFDGTATTATAGAQTLPANPAGFLTVQINGTTQKIPYYAN